MRIQDLPILFSHFRLIDPHDVKDLRVEVQDERPETVEIQIKMHCSFWFPITFISKPLVREVRAFFYCFEAMTNKLAEAGIKP